MKFLHISDLHIGRTVYGYDMTEDQEFILSKIIHTATVEKVDAVFVAGDVYDKSVPSSNAVEVLCLYDKRKPRRKGTSFIRKPSYEFKGCNDLFQF